MFEHHAKKLLEKFFPPKYGVVDGVLVGVDDLDPNEQGWAGNVKERPYRDGIDRTFKEGRA